jgi:adenylate cyclase
MADGQSESHAQHEEVWRAILMGEQRGLRLVRRLVGWMPTGPRCKLCLAPLKPPGSVVLKLVGFGPSRLNRRLCRACVRSVEKHPGGAEIELSFLFADVRGSTSLAEGMSAQEFSGVISRFYGKAAAVIDSSGGGIVDKFVGDEVVALFIPGFAGTNHAEKAIAAARRLVAETDAAVGAGVHTGVAYVGQVGEGDVYDFTAVGDAANTTSRLAASAGIGEILVSAAAAGSAGLDTADLETRTLDLRGRDAVVEAVVLRA